jgi:hypothetical protein
MTVFSAPFGWALIPLIKKSTCTAKSMQTTESEHFLVTQHPKVLAHQSDDTALVAVGLIPRSSYRTYDIFRALQYEK